MKMRVIVALLLTALMMTLTACQTDENYKTESPSNAIESEPKKDILAYEGCKYLPDGEWVRRDEKLKEELHITFKQDGEYAYRCDCGKHTGDFDALQSYRYDAQSKKIALSGRDGASAELELLYADEDYLILKFDDGVHIFKDNASEIYDTVHVGAVQYFPEGERALLTALSYEDAVLTVAPYNYDADAKEFFKDRIYQLATGDDVVFSSVNVTVDNGKPHVETFELDREELLYVGEYYTSGFFMFDAEGNVDRIIFYGENWIDG